MTNAEWRAIALFAGAAIVLSFLDGDLALGYVLIIGVIIVVTTMGGK